MKLRPGWDQRAHLLMNKGMTPVGGVRTAVGKGLCIKFPKTRADRALELVGDSTGERSTKCRTESECAC